MKRESVLRGEGPQEGLLLTSLIRPRGISHLSEAPDTPAQSPVEEEPQPLTDTLQTSTKTTTRQKQQQEESADSATTRPQEEDTINTGHPSIPPSQCSPQTDSITWPSMTTV